MKIKKIAKYAFYPIEAVLFGLVVFTCFVLPFSWGSAMGGALLSALGPLLSSKTKIVCTNLKLAGFSYTEVEIQQLVKKMWENLGRTFCEYVRLPYQDPFQDNGLYEIEGLHHIDALIHDGKPGLLFSAHFGNWELGTYVAQKRGLVTAQITRFLNNPLVRDMVNWVHGRVARKIIPKGEAGAKEIIRELKRGHHVSMLGDQKNNLGEAVPFFTQDAMTAKAFAKMALKYDCPLVPFHVIRKKGVRCKIIYEPPLVVPDTGTESEKISNLLLQMNQHIESWIHKNPEQWFWVHRRWPNSFYKNNIKKGA